MAFESMAQIFVASPKNEQFDPFDLKTEDVVGSELIPIFVMGIFNPLGPTIVALNLIAKPDSPSAGFLFTQLNPFAQKRQIFARCTQTPEFIDVIPKLYAVGDDVMLLDLPDFVLLATDIQPVADSVRSLIQNLLRQIAHEEDLKGSMKSIQDNWCDPWRRVPSFSDSLQNAISNRESDTPPTPQTSVITDATFSEWYELLQRSEYIAAEIGALIQGWDGAIKFQGGGLPSMDFIEAATELGQLGHPVFQELVR